jgi:hypothetical protein
LKEQSLLRKAKKPRGCKENIIEDNQVGSKIFAYTVKGKLQFLQMSRPIILQPIFINNNIKPLPLGIRKRWKNNNKNFSGVVVLAERDSFLENNDYPNLE